MVRVVVGDPADFNAMVYGYERHPGTVNYLENQFSNFGSTLNEAGKSFFSNAKQVFEDLTSSSAMRAARAALRKAGSIFQRDEIRSIWDLGGIQTAPLAMQRRIMAMPSIRELWNQQRCDGYSDTYVDLYPGMIGDNHYDYRRQKTGVVQELKNDDDAEYVIKEFIDDIVEGDRELDTDEKADIEATEEAVNAFVQLGHDDPTSVFGGML